MKTLEQIKNFTPKQRNEFIDEMIEIINWRKVSVFRCIHAMTDFKKSNFNFSSYIDALRINNIYLTAVNKNIIPYLKSIKTAE